MSNRIRWMLTVAGGIVASLAWWGAPPLLMLVCFVPLLFVEENIQQQGEPVLSLLPFSFIFFFLWNLAVCWWMARIHFLGGMSVITLNAVLMGTVFLLYAWIKRSTGGGPFILVILWIGFEFLHYRGDLSWPWLSLGNGLAGNIRLIQWYEYTGTTGGSLWILLVNVLLFSVIVFFPFRGRKRAGYLMTGLLVLLIVFPPVFSLHRFHTYKKKGEQAGFLILQPGLDPYDDKYNGASNPERLDHLIRLAAGNIEDDTRYIVTPETAVDSIWITDPDNNLSGRVYRFLEQYPATGMVLGATAFSSVPRKGRTFTTRTDTDGNYFDVYNSALFYYNDEPVQAYHKHYLANGVEQIPFRGIFGFLERLSLDLGGVSGSLRKGDGSRVFSAPDSNGFILGPLICFESAYGEYAASMTRKGADILIVMSNDGWFKNTGAYRQHLRLSQIRAVETRRSVVRAANTGVSAHISQRGEIAERIDWWEEGALAVKVAGNNRITFFSQYGDYTGRTALFFSVLIILNLLVRARLNFRADERFNSRRGYRRGSRSV
ncbi:MAG: apolipoprotein N-acyltransferase [Bacteroidales bacterium]